MLGELISGPEAPKLEQKFQNTGMINGHLLVD